MTPDGPTAPPAHDGVARRELLRMPLALAAAAGIGRALDASEPTRTLDSFEALAARWTELHAALDLTLPGAEEAYLFELAAQIARTSRADLPERQRIVYDADGMQTGPTWMGGSIFLVEVKLAPGTYLPPHNHPGFCVLTLGIEGACEVRHYEPEGEAPEAKEGTPSFPLRERLRRWITPGRFSELTRERDNIHAFRAGDQGATLLDFTTQIGDTSVGYGEFSALEISEEGGAAEIGRVVEGRWTGDPYS